MDFTQSELQLLAARVEKLEAQNRRWKLAGVFFALSSVSLVVMAAKPADRAWNPRSCAPVPSRRRNSS